MLVHKDITLSSYDKDRSVICTTSNRYFVVNKQVSEMFEILRSSENWDEAHQRFWKLHSTDFDPGLEAFQNIVYDTLGGKEILCDDEVQSFKQKKYLRLRQEVIPGHIVTKLVSPFTFLFNPAGFIWLMALLIVINVGAALYGSMYYGGLYLGYLSMWMFPLIFATTVIHEFGHIAACRAFGARHGGIGFGFYFIYPVNYADVNGVWALEKEKRIIVNLSGIYFELFYAFFLLLVFVFTNDPLFLLVASLVTLNTAGELYPFFRLDGYWVLSDWLGIPNLIENSGKQVQIFTKKLTSFYKNNEQEADTLSKKNLFLLLYGLMNGLITILFIGFILNSYWQEVWHFPVLLAGIVEQVLYGQWEQVNVSVSFLLVCGFYGLLIRYGIKYFIKWHNRAS